MTVIRPDERRDGLVTLTDGAVVAACSHCPAVVSLTPEDGEAEGFLAAFDSARNLLGLHVLTDHSELGTGEPTFGYLDAALPSVTITDLAEWGRVL